MCFNAPVVGLVAVVGVLLSATVYFYPPPPLSSRLLSWQQEGTFFSYQGHDVFYKEVKGSGQGGSLVCLHGFPTFSWDWRKVLPGLQSQFDRVILMDFLGFGLSDKPSVHSYSIFEQADIVTELAKHLEVNSAHLLSHDYGDTVALELLHRHNQAVVSKVKPPAAGSALTLHSLTMLNGGVFPETNNPRPLQKLLLVPVLGPALSRLTFFSVFRFGFGEVFGNEKPSEEEYTDFYAAIRHKDGHHVTASILQYIPERHANKERWVGALRSSHVPVLMIYGPADPVNPPQFADLFRKEAPHHRLVVLGDTVGHYPQWEDPDSTIYHMLQFLQQLPSSSSTSHSSD